jgi:hypothetical protein
MPPERHQGNQAGVSGDRQNFSTDSFADPHLLHVGGIRFNCSAKETRVMKNIISLALALMMVGFVPTMASAHCYHGGYYYHHHHRYFW